MVQLIIVYIIISYAIAYTVYSVIKTLSVKSKGGCGDGCACSAKDEIRKVLKSATIQNNTKSNL